MKIHQQGAKISNKTCSFEVSIGLLPLILIKLATEPLVFHYTHFNFSKVCKKSIPASLLLRNNFYIDRLCPEMPAPIPESGQSQCNTIMPSKI